MKGILLAGGHGKRLRPFTESMNKHFYPILGKEMILHSIEILKGLTISELIIVCKETDIEKIKELIDRSSSSWIKSVDFVIQNEPLGVAHGINLCHSMIGDEKFCALLGDNILMGKTLESQLQEIKNQKPPHIVCKKVDNPKDFGVVEIVDGSVKSIIEKPDSPKSNIVSIGLYFYDKTFFDIYKKISPSKRGEYEISSINRYYLDHHKLNYTLLDETILWKDCGVMDRIVEIEKELKHG